MADISKDDDEVVLERIMANGTFDELRKQLLEDLRTDVRRCAFLYADDSLQCHQAGALTTARCQVTSVVPRLTLTSECAYLLHMLRHP